MRQLLSDPDARADLALAVAIWIVSGTVLFGAARIPPPQFDPVGSAAIPQLAAIVLAVIAALILVRRVLRLRVVRAEPVEPQPSPGEPASSAAPLRPGIAVLCVAIMAAYALVMTFGLLGFREATIPFVILLGGLLCRFERRIVLVLVPSAIFLALGFGWLFTEILYIDLPVTRWLAR